HVRHDVAQRNFFDRSAEFVSRRKCHASIIEAAGQACRWRNSRLSDHAKLVRPRDAAKVLGISYSTLKRWIHTCKLQTVQTQGGHHRIPESELDKHLHVASRKAPLAQRRVAFRRISARNQLIGRIVDIKVEGIMAQVTLSIGGQQITSVITSD